MVTTEAVSVRPINHSEQYDEMLNHPFTKKLLATGNYDIEHHYDIQPGEADFSLTAATLSGQDKIAHTPITLVRKNAKRPTAPKDIPESKAPEETHFQPTGFPEFQYSVKESDEPYLNEMLVLYHLGSTLCGHEGIIHGGMLATLLDESLCRCAFPLLPNNLGVTASLNIKYLSPTRANSFVVLHARTISVDGRKAIAKGKISVISACPDEDYKLTPTVSAEILVIQPRWVSEISGTNKISTSKYHVKH